VLATGHLISSILLIINYQDYIRVVVSKKKTKINSSFMKCNLKKAASFFVFQEFKTLFC